MVTSLCLLYVRKVSFFHCLVKLVYCWMPLICLFIGVLWQSYYFVVVVPVTCKLSIVAHTVMPMNMQLFSTLLIVSSYALLCVWSVNWSHGIWRWYICVLYVVLLADCQCQWVVADRTWYYDTNTYEIFANSTHQELQTIRDQKG